MRMGRGLAELQPGTYLVEEDERNRVFEKGKGHSPFP
jgi:hypothetical protein